MSRIKQIIPTNKGFGLFSLIDNNDKKASELLIILYPIIMDRTTTIRTTILIFLLSVIDATILHIVLGNDRNVLLEYIYT